MPPEPRNQSTNKKDDRNVSLENLEQVQDRNGQKMREADGYSAETRKIDKGGKEDIDQDL